MKKKSVQNQKYEEYWKITLEYSNIYGENFNGCLKIIISFIDNLILKFPSLKTMTSEQYKELTNLVDEKYPKSDKGSVRKAINQFLKLGFINNGGLSYHSLSKKFLNSSIASEKRLIFSKIMYENASFSRSYSDVESFNQIKFFLKSLIECQKIHKDDIAGLMLAKEKDYPRGFVGKYELVLLNNEANKINFAERKYNQIGYLTNLCKKLSSVYYEEDYFVIDPETITESKSATNKRTGRDPYLQSLYKSNLYKESEGKFGDRVCYFDNIKYPTLIASHIKPYRKCDDNEQFDVENGLLLSRNTDNLFDQGYISFDDSGKIMVSEQLDISVIKSLSSDSLNSDILSEKRKIYLDYHREFVFKK